jgi:hypothetical protein
MAIGKCPTWPNLLSGTDFSAISLLASSIHLAKYASSVGQKYVGQHHIVDFLSESSRRFSSPRRRKTTTRYLACRYPPCFIGGRSYARMPTALRLRVLKQHCQEKDVQECSRHFFSERGECSLFQALGARSELQCQTLRPLGYEAETQ